MIVMASSVLGAIYIVISLFKEELDLVFLLEYLIFSLFAIILGLGFRMLLATDLRLSISSGIMSLVIFCGIPVLTYIRINENKKDAMVS